MHRNCARWEHFVGAALKGLGGSGGRKSAEAREWELREASACGKAELERRVHGAW